MSTLISCYWKWHGCWKKQQQLRVKVSQPACMVWRWSGYTVVKHLKIRQICVGDLCWGQVLSRCYDACLKPAAEHFNRLGCSEHRAKRASNGTSPEQLNIFVNCGSVLLKKQLQKDCNQCESVNVFICLFFNGNK